MNELIATIVKVTFLFVLAIASLTVVGIIAMKIVDFIIDRIFYR